MSDTTREHKLEAIIVDLLEGKSWRDIFSFTDLSTERSIEIAHDYIEIADTYCKRNAS